MQTNRNELGKKNQKRLNRETFGGSSPSIVTTSDSKKKQQRKIVLFFIFATLFLGNLLLAIVLYYPHTENTNPNQCQTEYKLLGNKRKLFC